MSSDARRFKATDRVIRSGIAGGVAGCVVCTVCYALAPLFHLTYNIYLLIPGEDGRRAA
jgi:hypothetical protein